MCHSHCTCAAMLDRVPFSGMSFVTELTFNLRQWFVVRWALNFAEFSAFIWTCDILGLCVPCGNGAHLSMSHLLELF